jgi:gliding motility-associated protein GldE
MESPSDPESCSRNPYPIQHLFFLLLSADVSSSVSLHVGFSVLSLLLLLFLSGVFSASENAFFSLTAIDLDTLNTLNPKKSERIKTLLSKPKFLLATILVGNNLMNIAFIILAANNLDAIFQFDNQFKQGYWLEFIVKVLSVTLFLLLFGEIIPKIMATSNNQKLALLTVNYLYTFQRLFSFIIHPLSNSFNWLEKKYIPLDVKISAKDLTHAIDLTTEKNVDRDEGNLLKGIVKFSNTQVRQIMKPRIDVVAVSTDDSFSELMQKVRDNGYSRMPVYEDTFDHITGIIYIKDLLPYMNHKESFNWRKLIKPALFVPEFKKIDDLLKEFQEKRVHLAIVTDEYGGKKGIITMEDILEEIFGEINDEFDETSPEFEQPDQNTFVFDAKILINDFCKITQIEETWIREISEEAETIGGFILELNGEIPPIGYTLQWKNHTFTIESADKRRIKKIRFEKNTH